MALWDRVCSPEKLRYLPDEALCSEVRKGNQEAFLALFDRYAADVFRLAYSVLRNKEEAEDLVQSLFLEVHTTMLRYDGQKGSFRTLLLRYAYTRAIDHRRRLECRRYYTCVALEGVRSDVFVRGGLAAAGLSQEDSTHLIEQAMRHLDAKQRTVVRDYFFMGFSLNEIAEEMGESFGNVRHHLYRGLEKMRKVLTPEEEVNEVSGRERAVTVSFRPRETKSTPREVSIVRARSV